MAITKDIQNGSEFFFNAWNGTTGYTLDLDLSSFLGDWIGSDPFFGQSGQSTLNAAIIPDSQYTNTGILYDGALTHFSTAFGSNDDGIEWSLVAYDNAGYARTIVSADNSATVTSGTNEQAGNLANTLDNMANSVNGFASTIDEDTYHITSSTDGAAYAGIFGSNYQGTVFDTTNKLGATTNLYLITQSSSAYVHKDDSNLVKQLGNADNLAITASTYLNNGHWQLKIELGNEIEQPKPEIETTPLNGSEFFFNAWNGDQGYTLDLDWDSFLGDWIGTDPYYGQTGQSTLDAAIIGSDQYDTNGVLYDGELTGFNNAFSGDFVDVEWSLVAYDNVGFNRSIVTADTSITLASGSNDDAKNLAHTLDNLASNANRYRSTGGQDTYHITNSTSGAAYPGIFGPTYKGLAFDTTNVLGASSNLYVVTQSSTLPADVSEDGLVKQLGNADKVAVKATTYEENGVWRLKIVLDGKVKETDPDPSPSEPSTPVVVPPPPTPEPVVPEPVVPEPVVPEPTEPEPTEPEPTEPEPTEPEPTEPEPTEPAKHLSNFIQSEIDSFIKIGSQFFIVGKNGSNEAFTESNITFKDGEVSVEELSILTKAAVVWGEYVPTIYTNPDNPELEAIYDYQLLGNVTGDIVFAGDTNDFINLLAGDDAAEGGAGNDILDGGLGSNFLTGGSGNDTFFLDGRAEGVITWSTITDFSNGDSVNIWGWVEGISKLIVTIESGQEGSGAKGFEGITNHYDLDGDGNIDTTITFSGLSELPNNSPETISENGYLLFN